MRYKLGVAAIAVVAYAGILAFACNSSSSSTPAPSPDGGVVSSDAGFPLPSEAGAPCNNTPGCGCGPGLVCQHNSCSKDCVESSVCVASGLGQPCGLHQMPAGDAIYASSTPCPDGLVCVGGATAECLSCPLGTCVPPTALGDPCDAGDTCGDGLDCSDAGRCAIGASEGADCGGLRCAAGLICTNKDFAEVGPHCVRPVMGVEGQSCGPYHHPFDPTADENGTNVVCARGLVCGDLPDGGTACMTAAVGCLVPDASMP